MKTTEKNINIELLRVISMLMILTLHYFNQGKVLELTEKSGGGGITYHLIWIIEAVCHISVNIYMMISGYFLSSRRFSWKRLMSFYSTVLFYSIVLSIICYSTGVASFSLKSLLSVFPIVGSRSNWYVTVYVAVLLISPLLNIIANTLERGLFKRVLIVLFVLFCCFPTFFFWKDQFDLHDGYSILWYSYIYLFAAYVRRFGVRIKKNIGLFMFSSIAVLPVSKFVISSFFSNTMLGNHQNMLYAYNSIPAFLASITVFIKVVNLNREITSAHMQSIILYLGKTSFGVFFIHSFVLLRDKLWIMLGSTNYIGSPLQILHGLICIVGVYAVCSFLDHGKALLFKKTKLDNHISRLSMLLDNRWSL